MKTLDDVLVARTSSDQMVADERGHLHYVTGQERRRRMLVIREREEQRYARVVAKRPLWRKIWEVLR